MIPFSYGYRNLFVRWKTTLMTAGGFTLVVAALIVMLAFVNGIRTVCRDTGDPSNVIVLSKGNVDEVLSRLEIRTVLEVESSQAIRRDLDGRLSSSREVFYVVTQPDKSNHELRNLQVRGVLPQAYQVHDQVRIIQGRPFRPGQGEVIVGRQLQRSLEIRVGDLYQIGRKAWRVVGVFDADGSMFESEFWHDLGELTAHFRREGTYNSVVVRARTPQDADRLAARLRDSRRISVEARTEPQHYAKQAEQTNTIYMGGILIATFMGIGAVFGVTNTMFAAISQRIKDIAVMRLLGFRRNEIMISFLVEALIISVTGGVLGTALGYCVNGLTLNFSVGAKAVAFAFTIDRQTILLASGFTLALGLIGGLLPSLSVLRVDPLDALR